MKIIFIIITLFQLRLLAQSTDYFPAHIGDVFIYESHDYESDNKTYDTTIVTNIISKGDGGIDIYYNNSNQPRYYKASNGNVYQYAGDKPCLWYDFTIASLDTFYTELRTELYVVVYDGGTAPFGNNTSSRSFTFNSTKYHSTIAYHWLGEGFGIIQMNSYVYPPSVSNLIGCTIDGKTYGTMMGVEDETLNINYELFQNYPNPFNPYTTIKYIMPTSGRVSIVIYNILGVQIKKLIDEYQNRGSHSVIFDATNYSSGVYFYKLKTNNYQQTKKLLLLK
jgi:hypothetical protein